MALELKHNKKYRFPWTSGNQFSLLVDGPAFFSAMIKDIQQAKHYILFEMYLVIPGQVSQNFFNALCEAAQRQIKIYVLFDDFGARTISDYQRQQLINCGIHLHFYNPLKLSKKSLMLFRDHRKLMVVDGYTAYVGGAGLMDEFDSPQPENNWHETMVRIQGCNVLQWQSLFYDNWQKWSTEQIELITPEFPDWSQTGRVTMTQGPRFMEIKRSFIKHVRNAQQRVWISTAYFAPSRKLRRELCRTARRGIDIRILIPGPITDNPMSRYLAQYYYTKLLLAGVRIYEYQPRFMHAKIVLCDDWVSTGSCNIDRWNLRWNLDANQEIDDKKFSAEVTDMFMTDFSNSTEILFNEWQKRSIISKIRTGFWVHAIRIADSLLTRLKIIRYWKQLNHRKGKQQS
ncbi:MAG TPA: phospholipase D-like domain-containing protein [Gammaproteobacteria bacterium]